MNKISVSTFLLSPEYSKNIPNTRFFYKQHFYKQRQAEIEKHQTNAKQHLEAQLLLFVDYSHSLSTLSSKNNRTYP